MPEASGEDAPLLCGACGEELLPDDPTMLVTPMWEREGGETSYGEPAIIHSRCRAAFEEQAQRPGDA